MHQQAVPMVSAGNNSRNQGEGGGGVAWHCKYEEPHKCVASLHQLLLQVGQAAFLTQLLEIGCMHGDPHPGNLLKVCVCERGGGHRGTLVAPPLPRLPTGVAVQGSTAVAKHKGTEDLRCAIKLLCDAGMHAWGGAACDRP
jgi:hypothetical protein